MIRVVIDTNVLVSAILAPNGPPARILKLALQGEFELILSASLIREIQEVIRYPKIIKLMKSHGVTLAETDDFIEKLAEVAIKVPDKLPVKAIPDDPKDDMILACAVEGRADCIVSGDSHLTGLKTFEGIPILSPAIFLRFLAQAEENSSPSK